MTSFDSGRRHYVTGREFFVRSLTMMKGTGRLTSQGCAHDLRAKMRRYRRARDRIESCTQEIPGLNSADILVQDK
jgi:hypothetical protein